MNEIRFEHRVIDNAPAGTLNDVCVVGDIDGDGLEDFVIGGKKGTDNIVWYRAPDWRRFIIGEAPLEAGGILIDLTGDGSLDLVAGEHGNGRRLYWFEREGDPTGRWTRRLITDRFEKYHDQAFGDVNGDGKEEVVFLSQEAGVLGYYDVPEDPRVEPWPDSHLHIIHEGENIEGLATADVDGDGALEIVAGGSIFKRSGGSWRRTRFSDYRLPVVATADLTGNGLCDIILTEGESDDGRLGWFEAPDWREHRLIDDLWHPHSLGVADFTGDGRPDIYVGEMQLSKPDNFRLMICRNRPRGFEPVIIDDRHPTHHARVIRVKGSPLPSIVGKPYEPGNQVDLWVNLTHR